MQYLLNKRVSTDTDTDTDTETEIEIGKAKYCPSCGEYWPADKEFFEQAKSATDGLARRCRACVKERIWAFLPSTEG